MRMPLLFLLEKLEIDADLSGVPHDACVSAIYLHEAGVPLKDGALYIGVDLPAPDATEGGAPASDDTPAAAPAAAVPAADDAPAEGGAPASDDTPAAAPAAAVPAVVSAGGAFVLTVQSDVRTVFNRAIDACFRYQEWCERFNLLLQDERNADELMRECSRLFGNAAYAVDSSFKVIAIDDSPLYSEISFIWKHLVEEGYLLYDIVYSMHKSSELEEMSAGSNAALCESENFNNPFINYNLSSGGTSLGHFFVVGYQKRITPGEIVMADLVGQKVAEFVERFGLSRARRAPHEGFIVRLMEGAQIGRDAVARQIAPWEWRASDEYYAIALRDQAGKVPLHDILAIQVESEFGAKVASLPDMTVGLVNASRFEAAGGRGFVEAFGQFVSMRHCVGGLSDRFSRLDDAGMRFRQAKAALERAEEPLCAFGESFVGCVADCLREDGRLDDFVDDRIRALVEQDAEKGTEYVRTLESYLMNDRRLNDTAKELFVHRNTLLYRIGRLKEMLGDDLENPELRMRFVFSIRALG